MRLFYLVFLLAFSLLILVNVTPAYAQVSTIESIIENDQNWLSVGFKMNDETIGNSHRYIDTSPTEETGQDPTLVIQYTNNGISNTVSLIATSDRAAYSNGGQGCTNPTSGNIFDSSLELFLVYVYPANYNKCIRGYVEFDISSIPDTADITNAYLTLKVDSSFISTDAVDVYFMNTRGSTITDFSTLYNAIPTGTQIQNADVTLRNTGIQNLSIFDQVIDTTPPTITLTGDNPQSIELGDGYTELGATTDDDSTVTIDSSDFSDSLGSYSILYDSTDSEDNDAIQVTRTVNVVDTTPPVITLTGDNPQSIELGDGYTELGATTDDDSTVTIDSSDFSDSLGSYSILYDSTDSEDNDAIQVTRTVNVVDTTPPVITLTGDNPQSIELGDGYTELGATTDDGSAVTITSNFVDSIGSYTISYNSVDSSGNNAVTVTRTVTVQETTTPDVTPPTITAPANITLESTEELTIVNIGIATATDNRDSNPTITHNAPNSFPYGITTITWTATDHSGNQSTITSTVTISDPRKPTQGETPLNELDKWIINHGGIYFGMGIFTFAFIIIGVMASPKTVPIFTIILVILAGLLHATGIFILPAWFWGIAIIMTITLVLKRKK